MKVFSKLDDCIVDAWLYDGTAVSLREAQKSYPAIRLVRSTKDHDVIYAEFQSKTGRARALKGQFVVKLPNGYLAVRNARTLRQLRKEER